MSGNKNNNVNDVNNVNNVNNVNDVNNVNNVNGVNDNYNQLSKKEQENASAQKAGELAGRAAADVFTDGQYEKIRNAPVVGNIEKKAEKSI